MSVALVSLDAYVLEDKYRNVNIKDFRYLEILYKGLTQSEPSEGFVELDVFAQALNEAKADSYGYIYESPSDKSQLMKVKFTAEASDRLFNTRIYLDVELNKINRKIEANKHHPAICIDVYEDDKSYKRLKEEADLKRAELKKAFLNDLFLDSNLEDNEHNRLICEKAWVVNQNTDYRGEYMSLQFYYGVEKWFEELKDLAI